MYYKLGIDARKFVWRGGGGGVVNNKGVDQPALVLMSLLIYLFFIL